MLLRFGDLLLRFLNHFFCHDRNPLRFFRALTSRLSPTDCFA